MDNLEKHIVVSTALSCLISIDFVGGGTSMPSVHDMVSMELPHILQAIARSQPLGLELESQLQSFVIRDPAALVQTVVKTVTDEQKAIDALQEFGHKDMIYASVKYMRKQARADEGDVDDMCDAVADVLGIDISDQVRDCLLESYVSAHQDLITV